MLQSREEHFLNNQDGTINQSANTWEFMPKFVSLHWGSNPVQARQEVLF